MKNATMVDSVVAEHLTSWAHVQWGSSNGQQQITLNTISPFSFYFLRIFNLTPFKKKLKLFRQSSRIAKQWSTTLPPDLRCSIPSGFSDGKWFPGKVKILMRDLHETCNWCCLDGIVYRQIQPSDLEDLERTHADLFPIRYELEFFLNVVNRQGIISWAAVDSQSGEFVGFVTTRMIPVGESEIVDLLRYDTSRTEQLVYILTLGVVEHYRNLGIASSLVQQVIKYASSITSCRAVYLHVIDHNQPAIQFYKKMLFKLIRRLPKFYYIRGQHYDSYLFVYYVNGGRSRCSPIEVIAVVATYVKRLYTSLTKLWRNDEKNIQRWNKCKESTSLLNTQNRRILAADSALCQCV